MSINISCSDLLIRKGDQTLLGPISFMTQERFVFLSGLDSSSRRFFCDALARLYIGYNVNVYGQFLYDGCDLLKIPLCDARALFFLIPDLSLDSYDVGIYDTFKEFLLLSGKLISCSYNDYKQFLIRLDVYDDIYRFDEHFFEYGSILTRVLGLILTAIYRSCSCLLIEDIDRYSSEDGFNDFLEILSKLKKHVTVLATGDSSKTVEPIIDEIVNIQF